MIRRVRLGIDEARRIALAAQGFDRSRPAVPDDIRHFRRVMSAIGVLQLDFVNVVLPAHFLMIWSRLGPYQRARFESYLYDSGEHIEQWAHEASIVAASDWPLLEHRRREFKQWKSSPLHQMQNTRSYLDTVLSHVSKSGPSTSRDLPAIERPPRKRGDWHRSIPRWALEHHFGKGRLAVRRRLKNFQRQYDLPERVIDDSIRALSVGKADAQRELLRKASQSLGVGTCHDLADYYRMKISDVVPRLEELEEEGAVTRVEIDGWSTTAYLSSSARIPRSIPGAALLSPFDPVVWFRPRALRLFDLDYRIEIYVPEHKRRWGYYVLPFREGDQITARIDLKADRKATRLLVQNAHLEPSGDLERTARSVAIELRELAAWLQLDSVAVMKASTFERTLARCLA